jgi:hypothetical protein
VHVWPDNTRLAEAENAHRFTKVHAELCEQQAMTKAKSVHTVQSGPVAVPHFSNAAHRDTVIAGATPQTTLLDDVQEARFSHTACMHGTSHQQSQPH